MAAVKRTDLDFPRRLIDTPGNEQREGVMKSLGAGLLLAVMAAGAAHAADPVTVKVYAAGSLRAA